MHPLSSYSWRMCLLMSTDTRLGKSHSSITYFAVFGWIFVVLISFLTILYYNFWGRPHLSWSETFPVLWNSKRISKMPLLEIPSFFRYCSLVYISSYSRYLHSHLFGNFHYDGYLTFSIQPFLFNRLPTKPMCDTWLFYCAEPHTNRVSCTARLKKCLVPSAFLYWISSNKLNLAKQA